MAGVTGIFNADFSAFYDAVQKADLHLKDLQSGASKVESAFGRMGDAFSGRKVIADASLMAEIFERAGGAAAFTEKELARMGATGQEAVSKLKALGKEVPEGIQRIANESRDATKSTDSWAVSIGKVVASYVAMQGIQKVWGFAKDIMDDASALEDLSGQTRMSVVELQNMGAALSGFGISMDEIGKAAFGLSKRIGSGDDSVNDALLQMGLSIEKVKGLKPTDLILTIADAGGKMNEQFKDTTFAALFGDNLGRSMAGAADKIREAYDRQKALNQAIGEDANKALADADRKMEEFYTKWRNAAAIKIFGPIAEGLNEYLTVSEKAGIAATTWARLIDSLSPKAWNLKTQFQTLKEETAALNPELLTSSMNVNALIVGYDGLAPKVDSTAGATKRLREEEDRLKKERFNPAETLAGFEAETEIAKRRQVIIDEEIKKTNEKAAADQAAHTARMAGGDAFYRAMLESAKATKQLADFDKNLAEEQKKIDEENRKQIDSFTQAGDAAASGGKKATDGATQAAQAQAQLNTQINLTIGSVKEWIELQQYSAAVNAILSQNGLFTSGSQYQDIANLGGPFSGLPGRAAGGPVSAGRAYVVGERGPELFVPNVSGNIATGGASITNIFHLTDTESNLARRVSEQIMRQVRAGTQMATT